MANLINWFKNKITFLNGSQPAINDVNLNDLQNEIESDLSDFVQGDLINNIPVNSENLESTNLKNALDELAASVANSATDITYDNTTSGLTAETVQDAIDELVAKGDSQVLWTNSSPTSSFGGKTITLTTNTFKYFLIFYHASTGNEYELSQIVQAGKSFNAVYLNTYTPGGAGHIAIYARRYCSSSQNSINFTECNTVNTSALGTLTTNNDNMIPVKVVGFNL